MLPKLLRGKGEKNEGGRRVRFKCVLVSGRLLLKVSHYAFRGGEEEGNTGIDWAYRFYVLCPIFYFVSTIKFKRVTYVCILLFNVCSWHRSNCIQSLN